MSTKTEVENIKTSGAEKVLAGVLAIFILIGGVWAYSQIGKISDGTYQDDYGSFFQPQIDLSTEDREVMRDHRITRNESWRATNQVNRAKKEVTFAGNAYRTEVDAGLPGTAALRNYREAQQDLKRAQSARSDADARLDALRPAFQQAQKHRRAALDEARSKRDSEDRQVAILRVILIAALLGGGVWSMSICRRRRSRLLPLALATIIAGALLAAWMAIDYGTSLGVFREIGPLAISVIGILLTTIAFIALQRYLAKKIPARRVRRKECPFCGYPGHGKAHCEGCGRPLVGECSTCHEPRRISTPHCGNCGAN